MRLIDADALYNDIIGLTIAAPNVAQYATAIINFIGDAPAVDAEPVKHGRWENERMLDGGFAEKWGCDCSVCKKTIKEPLWKPNYCPHCGSKMDLEE